jgi:Domain of unknown function (DUF4359)
MRKTIALGLCAFLTLFTGRVNAQASSSQDTAMDPMVIAVIELVVVLGVLYFLLPKKSKEESTEKRKSNIGLIIFGFVLLVMMVTNPSLDDHRQAVMHEMEKSITKSSPGDHESDSWEKIGEQLGESIGKFFLDRVVERENFLLFSISTVNVDHSKKDIGFGIFGHVWVYH